MGLKSASLLPHPCFKLSERIRIVKRFTFGKALVYDGKKRNVKRQCTGATARQCFQSGLTLDNLDRNSTELETFSHKCFSTEPSWQHPYLDTNVSCHLSRECPDMQNARKTEGAVGSADW
eukprot:1072975-Amphidinium_carterae.1